MQTQYILDQKRKESTFRDIKRLLSGARAAALLVLPGCHRAEPEPVDPHAGMVEVPYGSEGYVWVRDQKGVALSEFTAADFAVEDGIARYSGPYGSKIGVDVSEHQLDIDWQQVKEAGIDFAIIRAGYRGATQGSLNTDPYFRQNIQGALDAGLEVGAYIFSQAISRAEAVAEANYLIALLEDHKDQITMPVVFDWEIPAMDDARTKPLDGDSAVTEFAAAFCGAIAREGYTPGVYMNRHVGYSQYDLIDLADCLLWFSAPGAGWSDFYYRHSMWQYTFECEVPGIPTAVDMNLYIELPPPATPTPEPAE